MAASSQFFKNKRERDVHRNGGLALPDAKRRNSGFRLAHDSDIMALLDKIDNMDSNNSNPQDTHIAVNEAEGQMRLNGVIKSAGDEIGLKAETDDEIQSANDRGSNDQIVSVCDIGDFTYYEDVIGAELGFFVDHATPSLDLGILVNDWPCNVEGDSMPNILYSNDVVYGYDAENTEVFYGSLWEDDISHTEVFYGSLWEDDISQLNEHLVIQNDFASPHQEEFRVNGAEFQDGLQR